VVAERRHKASRIVGATTLLLLLTACGEHHPGQSAEQDQRVFASIRAQALPATLLASYSANKTCLSEHLDSPETACEAFHLAWHAEIVEYVVSRSSGSTETEQVLRAKAATKASLAAYKACLMGHLSDPEYACDAGRRTWIADVVEYVTMRNRARAEQTSDQ